MQLTPSYIGNFHLQTPDLSFIGLDEFVNKPVVENCKAMSSEEEPKVVRKNDDAPCIKEWVLDDEEEDVSQPKIEKKIVRPSIVKKDFVKSKQQEKTTRRTVMQIQVSDGLGPQKKLIFLPNVQGNPQMDLQDQGVIDSGCSRHMTRNMSYLTDYKEIDGGYVAFGGNPKGGKITRKGTIKTGNLDFENVYFVRELKFNLFSVSQMCDKKNSVLFNDTECIVLSPNFKLIDESQVLLRVYRKNNMYSVDLKNIVPKGGLTCLFAKATSDKSKLWHRRLGHLNFKTMNKLVKGNLVRGLPSKLFENDQTCVACQKEKASTELLTPTLSFMRPFGCPVTILNTIDHLGKFDGKADEGFFVGYSLNSKAFRVFIGRTRIVEENLHIKFSESTPNVAGTQSNGFAGRMINVNSNNNVNSTGTNEVNVVGGKTSIELPFDPNMPALEDYRIFDFSRDDEDDGEIRDLHQLNTNKKMVKEFGGTWEEPKKVIHTLNDPSWIDAMQEEILQFELQEVWTLVDLPNGKRVISSKWVFRNKKDERGIVIRNKADGFEDPDFPDKVYKVEKALYGLHQAPRAWYKGDILLVQVYVDDIIFGSTKKELCIAFEKLMHEKFQMSSMRELTFFLGLQVQQKKDGIFISQDKYVVGQFKEFWVTVVKTTRTPMETQFLLILRMEQCDYAGSSLDRKSTTRGKSKKSVKLIMEKLFRMELELMLVTQNGKKIIITEASIRRDLQLADEEGVDCLTNSTTFEQLTLMGLKITAWNEFSSTMASAIICLATNQKFNFSKFIFESSTIPTDPHHTPTFIQPSTQPPKTQQPRKPKRKDTQVPQPSDPIENVADEAIHKELGGSLVRAATTASSLEAEQDNGGGPRWLRSVVAEQEVAVIRKIDESARLMLSINWLKDAKTRTRRGLLLKKRHATLFQQLLEKRRKHFAAKRAEKKRNKPPTKAQQRKIMCTYLKNTEGYKLNDLKFKEFDSIQEMFDRAFKRVNKF
ncbi:retrovirus-related pol polyprotein from transposon TNT 1-94 [Tanacetum coccineum]